MIPGPFEYFAPATVAEAIGLLDQYGDDAKLLAGGHSLLPMMKLRLAAPAVLIDIGRITELRGVTLDGGITIGALTTYQAVERHAELRALCPALPETAAQIGDVQVRNRGTFGGSIAHADPAADLPAVVLALDAQIHAVGPRGARAIAASDFFVDILTTALAPDEIITAIAMPAPGPGDGAAYVKFPHPASRYAIVGAAAAVRIAGGKVTSCRLAITGAGPRATRQPASEQALLGSDGGAAAVARAAAEAGAGMEILGDFHAGEDSFGGRFFL